MVGALRGKKSDGRVEGIGAGAGAGAGVDARTLGSDITAITRHRVGGGAVTGWSVGRSATGCETVKAKKHSPPKRAIYYPQPFKYRTVREEIHT